MYVNELLSYSSSIVILIGLCICLGWKGGGVGNLFIGVLFVIASISNSGRVSDCSITVVFVELSVELPVEFTKFSNSLILLFRSLI